MADRREEIIREAFEVWNSGERKVPEVTHPNAVLHSLLTGATYEGHEGVRRWMAEIDDQFERWELWIDECRDAGPDRTLVLGGVHLRGRGSGVEFDQPIAWLFGFRDDLIAEVRFFRDHAEGIAAAEDS